MGVTGSLAAILKEALLPNLVQSMEGTPAFVHGGPFANIAHGCNSVLATRMALAFGEYAVTEAGFAFDLGAEKFFDIKCRSANLNPAAIVIVATIRALKMHGGTDLDALTTPDPAAVARGSTTSPRTSTPPPTSASRPWSPSTGSGPTRPKSSPGRPRLLPRSKGVPCSPRPTSSARRGEGAIDLAEKVVEATSRAEPPRSSPALPARLADRAEDRADRHGDLRRRRRGVPARGRGQDPQGPPARPRGLAGLHGEDAGLALGQPQAPGPAPKGFTLTVRDLEIAAGAGFVVALTGEIVRMPGLPERPAAERIEVDEDGEIRNLGLTCTGLSGSPSPTSAHRGERPVEPLEVRRGRPLRAPEDLAAAVEEDHRRVVAGPGSPSGPGTTCRPSSRAGSV